MKSNNSNRNQTMNKIATILTLLFILPACDLIHDPSNIIKTRRSIDPSNLPYYIRDLQDRVGELEDDGPLKHTVAIAILTRRLDQLEKQLKAKDQPLTDKCPNTSF